MLGRRSRWACELCWRFAHASRATNRPRSTLPNLSTQAARSKLEEDRAQLNEWGERLHTFTTDFDKARSEVRAAREEIESQRSGLVTDAAAVVAARLGLEEQSAAVAEARVMLNR